MSETFGHGHLRFSWNKLFVSCKEEYLLPPSGFYTAPPPVQSWPYFLTFLPRDVVPLPAPELAWHKSLCLKCPTCQCKCPCEHWHWELMQAQQEHCDFPACSSPISCEGFIHSCKYLVVQTPCNTVLHDSIPGFVWRGKMLLVKLEGQLVQNSEMKAPLIKFQDFCPTSAMSGIHLGNIRVL